MRFTDETRKKMSIKSDKYYESISKQDRSGVNNSFYGKKHSIESKAKIGRDIHGENNPFYGKKHSIESKNKMSNTRASKMSTGEIQSWHHNNGTHISIKSNNEESYDSKLELFRMIQMDNDPDIIKWTKNHNIKIEYKINNIIKNYVPDFIVEYTDGSIYIEEVKGWDINANSKFDALVQYCKTSKFKYKWHQQDASIFLIIENG